MFGWYSSVRVHPVANNLRWLLTAAACAAQLLTLGGDVWACRAADDGPIRLYPSLLAARLAEANERPAPEGCPLTDDDAAGAERPETTSAAAWCGWCRKLEADTLSDQRMAELGPLLWVKVDVDDQPELAARYQVRGLPQTLVLDGDDRVIGSQPGYLPPDRFADFVKRTLAEPQPQVDVLGDLLTALEEADDDARRQEAVVGLLRHAGQRREVRREALAALERSGPSAWPALVELLGHGELGVRAAAAGALMSLTRAGLPFDAFAPGEERAQQQAAWRSWLASQSSSSE